MPHRFDIFVLYIFVGSFLPLLDKNSQGLPVVPQPGGEADESKGNDVSSAKQMRCFTLRNWESVRFEFIHDSTYIAPQIPKTEARKHLTMPCLQELKHTMHGLPRHMTMAMEIPWIDCICV